MVARTPDAAAWLSAALARPALVLHAGGAPTRARDSGELPSCTRSPHNWPPFPPG